VPRYKRHSSGTSATFLGLPRGEQPGRVPNQAPASPSTLERWALKRLLAFIGDPPIQFVLWNGEQVPDTGARPLRRVYLHDRQTLWRLVINPDLRFGDAYTQGRLDVDGDLVDFLPFSEVGV